MPSDFEAARAAGPAAKRWGDRACAVHDAFVGMRWTDDSGKGGLNRLLPDLQVSAQSPSVATHCVQVAGPLQLAACAADPFLALHTNQQAEAALNCLALGPGSGQLHRFCDQLVIDEDVGAHGSSTVVMCMKARECTY